MNRQTLLLLVLVLSLALNLLGAGYLLGRGAKAAPHAGKDASPVAWAARQLEPELRQMIRRRMAEQGDAVRPLRQELRVSYDGLRRAVQREPFDGQGMVVALERLRKARERYEAFIHENLVVLSGELPREQREKLLRAALQRGAGGMGKAPSSRRPEQRAVEEMSSPPEQGNP